MTDLNLEDVVSDIEETHVIPTEEKISGLARLSREQLQLEQDIEELGNQMKAKSDQLKTLSEMKIPEIFNELGISEFKLNNGLKVRVAPYYSGKADSEEAFNWLEEHGHEDIIKGEFTILYRRENKAQLSTFMNLASNLGFQVKDKLAVHPMTMKSWVREQIESGVNIPRDLFQVFTGFKTKIGK